MIIIRPASQAFLSAVPYGTSDKISCLYYPRLSADNAAGRIFYFTEGRLLRMVCIMD